MTDSPDDTAIRDRLGLIADLAGTWQGDGLNTAARPDFGGGRDVLLSVSATADTVAFTPIPAVIHNRGFAQPDLEAFGFTYLQQVHDAVSGGPLHIETGMWITLPATIAPAAAPPPGGQLVARMWNIPHGASMVAQGFALPFTGPPAVGPGTDPTGGADPAFSCFPSFNSTPLRPAFPDPTAAVCTAGSSGADRFAAYAFADPRTLPPGITQTAVNDPIVLLQQTVQRQLVEGYRFTGVVLNIATAAAVPFGSGPVDLPQFGGGVTNHTFLRGDSEQRPNLSTALVYATFWLQRLTHPDGRPPVLQLQYAQTALVNFPARSLPGPPNISWPHVTAATLRKLR